MLFLIFVGVVLFIFGVLLLFFPQALRNLCEKTNRVINKLIFSIDEKVYSLRIGVGTSLILVSCLSFFIVYFLIKKF